MLITGVTPADVFTLTGVSVDAQAITRAIGVIELHASVDLGDFSGFDARNRKWLQMAVAYQAAAMASQPSNYGGLDFKSLSQDGLAITLADGANTLIDKYAKKALSRVSWARPRTALISPGRQTRLANRINAGGTDRDGAPISLVPGAPYTEEDFEYGNDAWL